MKKRMLVALAGLVGLGSLIAAPVSMAGVWVHYGPGPAVIAHPVVYGPAHRHVVVHRWCHGGYCRVHRHVWYN